MSTVILGVKARENHGIREKYPSTLNSTYKGYIDELETAMMQCVYDPHDTNDCIVTKTFNIAQVDIDDQISTNSSQSAVFTKLREAIIHFCKLHDSSVVIQENYYTEPKNIVVTVDMKVNFFVDFI